VKRVAIIGGSGLERLLAGQQHPPVSTPFGDVSYIKCIEAPFPLFFLPRHGPQHAAPPHAVNYRANIWAIAALDVSRIIAVSAVGSMDPEIPPGSFVIPDNAIDFTRRRTATFFENEAAHVDMTQPFCPEVRSALINACRENQVRVYDNGVYVCTEGPRFETAAEIQFYRRIGGTVVGMTLFPELPLAREKGICYASLCVVTNFAAGISSRITVEEVFTRMRKLTATIRSILLRAATLIPEQRSCTCGAALQRVADFI